MTYKLGSLFDGSGGFPLAGSLCGIEPVWASEVEPYPIAVTRSHFPNMKHLGDISKINGAEVEPVDIITFGSPCQDLSVAGKRAGLKHEANGDEETTRSGLFMEAVRIIKEMRAATNGRFPAYALWENVPGAFSSNGGEDFRIVLEELIKIVEPTAVMPAVPKNGWAYADCYMGDGWSLAYRVFDAQYWGVPQRRRRIHLVLDLGGERAGKVLFEREGLRGYFAKGGTPWKATAAHAEDGSGADDRAGAGVKCLNPWDSQTIRQYAVDGVFPALSANSGGGQNRAGVLVPYALKIRTDNKAPTITAAAGMSGNNQPVVCYDARGNGDGKTASTITGDHENRITDYTSVVVEPVVFDGANVTSPVNASNPQPGDPCHTLSTDSRNWVVSLASGVEKKPVYCLQGNGIDRADTAGCNGKGWKEDSCYTLNTIDRPAVAYSIGNGQLNQISMSETCNTLDCMHDKQAILEVQGMDCRNGVLNGDLCGTLQAKPNGGFSYNCIHPVIVKSHARYIVRRLTPTECARLQGFADRWGDIDPKTEFSDEEYRFWQEVRNTHAAVILGKEPKEYTKEQMLTWYNKLHTDSSEYKMWGNGIALPPALYCMQGMVDALNAYNGEAVEAQNGVATPLPEETPEPPKPKKQAVKVAVKKVRVKR